VIWLYECAAEECKLFKEDFAAIHWWKKLTIVALAGIGGFYGSAFIYESILILLRGNY
jgi:hypothetical protein